MDSSELTTLALTAAEAQKFLVFQEHFDLFEAMDKAGVLELKWGKATMNFAKGEVQSIQVESVSWKRGA